MDPKLCVVVLTWNEERNIGGCLDALAAQSDQAFEVVVVDAASPDGTAAIVASRIPGFPVPLRLVVAATKIPIGEARNRGVELATSDWIAFLSADATPESDWVRQARAGLRTHDLVFGAQVHAPHAWTVGAAVRGLRYHFPDGPGDPMVLASNVAAAYKRQVLARFPFDPWANAAEDLLLARRAVDAGFTARYDPAMRVRHHDVASASVEWKKNWREGFGCAVYRAELGVMRDVILWGAALSAALLLAAWKGWIGAATFMLVLWAPAFRRAARRLRQMPIGPLLLGVAASPAFDLAFLVQYLRGMGRRKAQPQAVRA
jgi:glycosyltransferase involved in cell wall biosynthesis